MTRHLPVLTNSSCTTFRRCPREYFFSYVQWRKSRKKSQALMFGSLFHAGLNAWWRWDDHNAAGAEWERLDAAIDALRRHAEENEIDPFDLVKAECLMAGYTARWGDEPYETIAVEKRFSVPIQLVDAVHGPGGIVGHTRPDDAYELRGSIDAMVASRVPIATPISGPARHLHNVESKTTSLDISAGSDYWRRVIALDSQVSTYNAAAKAMGYDVRDTIYDVTRKPELQPLKATPEEKKKYTKPTKAEPIPRLYSGQRETDETVDEYRERLIADIIARPDWYFARQTIVRLEHDDEAHALDIAQTAAMIRFAEERNAWPRSPNACERFHRMCDFFEVCSGETTIDDGTRYETKERQHEELSE